MRRLLAIAYLALPLLIFCGVEAADQPGYAHLVNGNGRCLASSFNSPNQDNWLIGWDCLPDERGQQWQQTNSGQLCNLHGKCIASRQECSRDDSFSFTTYDCKTMAIQRNPQNKNVERFSLTSSGTANYFIIKSHSEGECFYVGWRASFSSCTIRPGHPIAKSALWQWRRM